MSLFIEGYIQALRQSNPELGDAPLADETLARIMEDSGRAVWLASQFDRWDGGGEVDGRSLWQERQDGNLADFPPLTVALSDAGKVVFL